jgi:hypothetical protein
MKDDIARWATKFAKKGVRGAVNPNVSAAPPPRPQVWGPPQAARPWGEPIPGSTWGGKPPELETLVKPGPSSYADALARVPELYPDMANSNAMEGPLTQDQETARREALMGLDINPGVRPDDGRDAVPRGYRGVSGGAHFAPLAELPKTTAMADQLLTEKLN